MTAHGESMGTYCFSTTVTFTSGNLHQQSQNQESDRMLMLPSNNLKNRPPLNQKKHAQGNHDGTMADSALSNSEVGSDSDNIY
jgi:hypothetical protein